MDERDTSDTGDEPNLKFGNITETIIGTAFEGKVIVELKAVKAIAPEHQAQFINYLKATEVEVY